MLLTIRCINTGAFVIYPAANPKQKYSQNKSFVLCPTRRVLVEVSRAMVHGAATTRRTFVCDFFLRLELQRITRRVKTGRRLGSERDKDPHRDHDHPVIANASHGTAAACQIDDRYNESYHQKNVD